MGKKKILLTVPQYAAHRGKNEGAIRYAIREGKLSKSVVRDGAGGVLIDRDVADQEYVPRANPKEPMPIQEQTKKTKNKKKSKKKKSGSGSALDWDPANPYDTTGLVPVNVSRMRREAHEAELARLKVEREQGKLIPADDVQKQWVKIATITKTKILGIPSKSRQRMPELTDGQYGILEMIVREALEEITSENVTTPEGNE